MNTLKEKAEHLLQCKNANLEKEQNEVIAELAKKVDEGGKIVIEIEGKPAQGGGYSYSMTEEEFAKIKNIKDTDVVMLKLISTTTISFVDMSMGDDDYGLRKVLQVIYNPSSEGIFSSPEQCYIYYIEENSNHLLGSHTIGISYFYCYNMNGNITVENHSSNIIINDKIRVEYGETKMPESDVELNTINPRLFVCFYNKSYNTEEYEMSIILSEPQANIYFYSTPAIPTDTGFKYYTCKNNNGNLTWETKTASLTWS